MSFSDILAFFSAAALGAFLLFNMDSVEEMRKEYEDTYYGDVKLKPQEEEVYILIFALKSNDKYIRNSLITGEAGHGSKEETNFLLCLEEVGIEYLTMSSDIYYVYDIVNKCLTIADVVVD